VNGKNAWRRSANKPGSDIDHHTPDGKMGLIENLRRSAGTPLRPPVSNAAFGLAIAAFQSAGGLAQSGTLRVR